MSIIVSENTLIKQLKSISFSDPFSENTLKIRKNLLISSFVGLIFGAYSIKIDGFFGINLQDGSISAPVLSGILSVLIIYFLISYGLNLTIELLAWDYKKERLQIIPYLTQLQTLHSKIDNLGHILKTTNSNIENIYSKIEITKNNDALSIANHTSQEVINFSNEYANFKKNELPYLFKNAKTIYTVKKLNLRLIIRLLSLFFLDIVFPIIFSYLALSQTMYGISAVTNTLI